MHIVRNRLNPREIAAERGVGRPPTGTFRLLVCRDACEFGPLRHRQAAHGCCVWSQMPHVLVLNVEFSKFSNGSGRLRFRRALVAERFGRLDPGRTSGIPGPCGQFATIADGLVVLVSEAEVPIRSHFFTRVVRTEDKFLTGPAARPPPPCRSAPGHAGQPTQSVGPQNQ